MGAAMKRALTSVALALGIILTSGCTAENATTPAPTGSATEASSPSAAPGPAEPTVEQWASEIAKLRANYNDIHTSWEDAICSASAVPDAPYCSACMVAMGFTAQTVQITLDGLQKETGPTYLGGVPAEIAPLLAETTAAAQVAAEASKAVACPGDNCVGTAFTFERAWDDLGTSLAGWDPYL